MDDILTVTLPHGLFVEGRRHQVARLRVPDVRQQARAADAHRLPPAHWASRLLAHCLAGVGDIDAAHMPDLARRLTVGDREALLLHLIRAIAGDHVRCVVDCPHDGCGQRMDVETTVTGLLLPPYQDAGPWHEAALDEGGEPIPVRFRLPTGADQEAAAETAAGDAGATGNGGRAAARTLLRRISRLHDDAPGGAEGRGDAAADVGGRGGRSAEDGGIPLGAPDEAALERLLDPLLAEVDPQAEIRFDIQCAGCGRPVDALFDATSHLIEGIARRSAEVEWEVHYLALHYHWSERDILALDEGRRRRYIQRILDEPSPGVVQ